MWIPDTITWWLVLGVTCSKIVILSKKSASNQASQSCLASELASAASFEIVATNFHGDFSICPKTNPRLGIFHDGKHFRFRYARSQIVKDYFNGYPKTIKLILTSVNTQNLLSPTTCTLSEICFQYGPSSPHQRKIYKEELSLTLISWFLHWRPIPLAASQYDTFFCLLAILQHLTKYLIQNQNGETSWHCYQTEEHTII